MMRHITFALLCIGFALQAQPSDELDPIVQQKLDSITTADVPRKSPGIAVAIVKGQKVLYEKYRGYADLSDSVLISNTSRFNIASNGKQFTALAILLLEKKKKISLQDDIRKYFPSLLVDIQENIPIESLLNHSSGIRDVYDLLSMQGITWWKQTMSNADLMALIHQQKHLNFKPESRHLYSNSNYIVLAALIEKVTGQSFVDFTTILFNDLGMTSTSFEDEYRKIKGPIAKPYFNFSTWTSYEWIWNATGDGNLFTTLPDLIRWEKIINGSAKCRVPRSVIERSQKLTANQQITNYGYGVELKTYKGLETIQHEGATGAWKAFFIRIPSKQLSFITMTNSGKVLPAYQTMPCLDLLLNLNSAHADYKIKPDRPGPTVTDDDIPGIYTNGEGFFFEFLQKEGSDIYLRRYGRSDVQLIRESTNIFRQLYDSAFRQEFKRDSTGNLTVTAYHPSHPPYTLRKQQTPWDNFEFALLKGTFTNAETGARMEITDAGKQQVDLLFNGKKATARLLSPGKMILNSYYITFDPTNIGVLYLNGDRIKDVDFRRK